MYELKMKIYDSLPIHIQNVATSVDGYRKSKNRFGGSYQESLAEIESRNYTDRRVVAARQEEYMRRIIQHAVQHSPFYKEFYKGIDIASIQTIEDLKRLPVLEKEMVRQNLDKMYTIPEEKAAVSLTSGTSGTPLKVLFDKRDVQQRFAFLNFFKKQHGAIPLKMKQATFSSFRFIPKNQKAPIYWRDNVTIKQRLYSTYFCHASTAGDFARNLNKYQPGFIDGIPSAIYEVSKWINENNYELSFTPAAIFTTGETLYPYYRDEIERAFGCPVRDQYASSEGAPFIAECTNGKLHYNTDTGIVETSPDGTMLVTCFHTRGTPLIRYAIGDSCEIDATEQACSCGSAHPVVRKLKGRTDEYLLNREGRKFTSLYLSMVSEKYLNAVRKMQFIQHDIDTVEAIIEVKEGATSAVSKAVEQELAYMLGDNMNVTIRLVDKIPMQRNGKYRLIINHLKNTAKNENQQLDASDFK